MEIADIAILSFLWSHMFSFSIASVTILTYCIIIVIGMLMCCHLPSAYDSLWSSSPSHCLLVTSRHSHAKSFIFLIGLDNQLLFTRGTFPLDCLQISTKLAELWKLELLDLAVPCKISIYNTFYWSNALATCSGMRRWMSDWKFHKIGFQKLN